MDKPGVTINKPGTKKNPHGSLSMWHLKMNS